MMLIKQNRTLTHLLAAVALTSLGTAQDQNKDEVQELKKKVGVLETQVLELLGHQDETEQTFDEYDEQFSGVTKNLSNLRAGKRDFLLTGYADGGFQNAEGDNATFGASFVPIFLWKLNEQTFLEGEVEFGLGDTETEIELEYLQMSYVINDSMILGFGKFLNPGNPFAERYHPSWINKLPTAPLGLGPQRIMPFTQVGVQLHGAVPVGQQKLNYAVYVSNGPTLEEEDTNYGTLADENLTDSNDSKAIGGRLGFFPMPELELGYAIELAKVTASGSDVSSADATIQSIDLAYTSSAASGTLDVRSQWAFSDVDDVIFDPTGADFGPVSLNNKRSGGYVQGAYRFSEAKSEVLSRFEGVLRFDQVNLPSGAPEGTDESRWTIGVNYWTSASSLFKLAYQIDDTDAPGADSDAVFFQWSTGL